MLKKMRMPYLISGIVFLAIACAGGRYLHWEWEEFAFLLVVYLVVIIGIRLDEVSGHLSEIQAQLAELRERLIR